MILTVGCRLRARGRPDCWENSIIAISTITMYNILFFAQISLSFYLCTIFNMDFYFLFFSSWDGEEKIERSVLSRACLAAGCQETNGMTQLGAQHGSMQTFVRPSSASKTAAILKGVSVALCWWSQLLCIALVQRDQPPFQVQTECLPNVTSKSEQTILFHWHASSIYAINDIRNKI